MLSVRLTTPNVNEDSIFHCFLECIVRQSVRLYGGVTPPTLLTVDGLCFVKEHFVNPHRHVGPCLGFVYMFSCFRYIFGTSFYMYYVTARKNFQNDRTATGEYLNNSV